MALYKFCIIIIIIIITIIIIIPLFIQKRLSETY